MSVAPKTLDCDLRFPPVTPGSASEVFVEQNRELLEARLSDVCSELGRGLGGLSDELARAVGTEGRGGRRWRPLLTLAAAEAFGGSREDALRAAICVELTHTASLVLDDLPCMDDSSERRGQPSAHRRLGSAGAILLSVSLLAHAVELLGRVQSYGGALCEQWGQMVGLRGMAGGQAMDVAASGRVLMGAKRRLHREKSAALPAFALSAGATLAGAGGASRLALASFGRSVGWAYQLVDDAEDVEEDGLLGRSCAARRPLLLSARIMRRAYRRLADAPGLPSAGCELLSALAGQVVVPESGVAAIAPGVVGTEGC